MVDTTISWATNLHLLIPILLAFANNVLVENVKQGIKSAYPESKGRFWMIILFVFILGIFLYGVYAYVQKEINGIEAILTPALSLAYYQFKPYRRLLNYAKVRANEKGATEEDKDA